MKLIYCPHCSHKVSVDNDNCSQCHKKIFDTGFKTYERDYDIHYSDFMSSTFTPRGVYKFQVIMSMIVMMISAYVIFYENYNSQAPDYAYFLFLTGLIIYGVTRALIWKDKKASKHKEFFI